MDYKYQALSLLILPFIFNGTTSWPTTVIDERVTVQTPTQLHIKDTAILVTAYKAKHLNTDALAYIKNFTTHAADGCSYQVARTDGSQAANVLDWQLGPKRFYEQSISKFIKTFHGRIVERSTFTTPGGEGVEIKCIVQASTEKIAIYQRMLLLGKVGYVLSFGPPSELDTTGVAGAAQRRRFFDSIIVKP